MDCPICFEKSEEWYSGPCGHVVCGNCKKNQVSRSHNDMLVCSICRVVFHTTKFTRIFLPSIERTTSSSSKNTSQGQTPSRTNTHAMQSQVQQLSARIAEIEREVSEGTSSQANLRIIGMDHEDAIVSMNRTIQQLQGRIALLEANHDNMLRATSPRLVQPQGYGSTTQATLPLHRDLDRETRSSGCQILMRSVFTFFVILFGCYLLALSSYNYEGDS
ncbi:hypothetical protein C8Q75DRAFT_778881 [Abortiporus biennis]|nr:hypothetical protein C8Q75DRAFT_778881 [Abortiporus biennis]